MADPGEPFEAAMRLLGRRWTGGVVRAMLGGARHHELLERFDARRSGRSGLRARRLATGESEPLREGFPEPMDRMVLPAPS